VRTRIEQGLAAGMMVVAQALIYDGDGMNESLGA
jgi:hypothetical protein